MDQPAFDLDRALALVEDDSDLLASTARTFLQQDLGRQPELSAAVARSDAVAVERIAHSIVGAAGCFAADETERAARALEKAAAAADLPAFPSLMERLDTALSELGDDLSAYCARHELRHVLIAEDDDVRRLMLESLLSKWNYRVTAVSRGDVALELLGNGPPYLALIDWMMPGLDGLQVCKALRARKSETYTYVILMTGKDADDALVTGFEAGADDFISLPVGPEELRARLRAGQRIVELQERLLAQRQGLRRSADRDGLTGRLSRRRVLSELAAEIERCAAADSPLSVLALDIVGMRQVNERHGRNVGDQALRVAGERMQRALRQGDPIGRLGGDEFLAVLPNSNRRNAIRAGERIAAMVSGEPIVSGEASLKLSARFGVAQLDADAPDADTLLKSAQQELSRAKAARDGASDS